MDELVTVTVDDLLGVYTDVAFLDFIISLVALVPSGLILSVIVYLIGWFAAWVFTVLRKIV